MSYKAFSAIKQHIEIETLKSMSIEEINDLLNKMKAERDELRAQLARCVEVLKDIYDDIFINENNRRHTMIEETLKTLPQQAKLGAEVLRCAEDWYESNQDKAYGREAIHLESAVRAAKDGE